MGYENKSIIHKLLNANVYMYNVLYAGMRVYLTILADYRAGTISMGMNGPAYLY